MRQAGKAAVQALNGRQAGAAITDSRLGAEGYRTENREALLEPSVFPQGVQRQNGFFVSQRSRDRQVEDVTLYGLV